ncbi:MAG: energy transducer TonB, partial [Bacteroidota bacterium]
CLVGSLVVLIALIKLWPVPDPEADPETTLVVRGQELIEIDQILPTSQEERRPPPPAPLLPVVVPDDVLLEDEPLDLSDQFLLTEEPGEDAEVREGVAEGQEASTRGTMTGPKAVRFVEPEMTRAARRRNVRAVIIVEVSLDVRGRVQDTNILERYLLGRDEAEREAVPEVGYGLEEAALAAARRWLFRPAQENGVAVPSTTTLTFSFGV